MKLSQLKVEELNVELEKTKSKERKVWLFFIGFLIVAVLVGVGVYKFDRFQVEKVFIPLCKLAIINDNIRYNQEQEATLRGYVDTTPFSEEIKELWAIRDREFYNNSDSFVAFLCKCPAFVKFICLLVALPLGLILTGIFVYLLFSGCFDIIKTGIGHRRRIKRIKRVIERKNRKNKLVLIKKIG